MQDKQELLLKVEKTGPSTPSSSLVHGATEATNKETHEEKKADEEEDRSVSQTRKEKEEICLVAEPSKSIVEPPSQQRRQQQQQQHRPHNKKKRNKKSPRLSQSAHIGIVGCGIGGLSTALALVNAGYTNITIYERDDHGQQRRDGYGLTLTYNPRGPLAQLGILEDVARMDCPSRSHYIFRSDGSIMGYYGNAFLPSRGMGQRGNLRVPRQVLRQIMLDRVLGKSNNSNKSGSLKDDERESSCEHYQHVNIQWGKRLNYYVDRTSCTARGGEGWEEYFERTHETDEHEKPVFLQFDDGTTDSVDLLVGADGIKSVVAKQFLSWKEDVDLSEQHRTEGNGKDFQRFSSCCDGMVGLRYLNVMIILGITEFYHPLLDERGFYTLDGTHRLFTMPFEGCRLDDACRDFDESNVTVEELVGRGCSDARVHVDDTYGMRKNCAWSGLGAGNASQRRRRRKIMWQLSYRLEDEEEAMRWSQAGPRVLKDEVLRRCQGWHDPVIDMIRATQLETIWGSALMDRDPEQFLHQIRKMRNFGMPTRVVVLGDAAHAMSPFKGQGANQALADGPLLISWLQKSAIDSAVRGFMREMVSRTAGKVLASREAACYLHSTRVLLGKQEFAGVRECAIKHLLEVLQMKGIGTGHGDQLDDAVREVITELGARALPSRNDVISADDDKKIYENQALLLSANGDAIGLRNLSMHHADSIRTAMDETRQTCLHLSALGGHDDVCRWLLSEVCAEPEALDMNRKTPLNAAIIGGNARVVALLAAMSWERLENRSELSSRLLS